MGYLVVFCAINFEGGNITWYYPWEEEGNLYWSGYNLASAEKMIFII